MEDLQPVLIVLSAVAIIAVLVHGFWSIRKQQPKGLKDSPLTGRNREASQNRDREGFDADGIGEVRVRKMTADDRPPKLKTTKRPKMVAEPADADPDPFDTAEEMPEDVAFELSSEHNATRAPKANRHEPQLSIEEEAVAEEEPQLELGLAEETPEDVVEEVADDEPLPAPRDVLALHVVARSGQQLNGAELLPALLALNFKYGEMQIFHRHEDNAGHGKVLFSLANMVKPGVFDPDNMEQFTTQGIVLFMTLPCYGDALFNFSNMLNSAQQLADDLDALLLDGERNIWSNESKAAYLERIRANA
ncbi:cell division protein ZipA [Shewanella sp.]|uniref:cell division protein ZipA n=1 Tax=Shewanella sp. TaxID=50422 RepID=UPI003A985999